MQAAGGRLQAIWNVMMTESDQERLGVVVVTHGQLAHELVNAAEMIAGELVRFEGNSVQLAATYTLLAADGTVRHGSFTASPRTWDGKDYGVLVGQIREAVNDLGDALAAALGT